jgi:ABC-type nitrate/sulfonate/bicarbonate transport system permease component
MGAESRDATLRWLLPALIVGLLLGLWQLAADWHVLNDAFGIDPLLVPSPSEIAQALWEDRALLADNAWVTLQEVLLGFACALAAGVGFALAMHLSETLRRAFYPLLVASQTVPVIVLAPIFVVWFGFGIGHVLAIVTLICFFPITVNTLDGLRSVDPDSVKMMRTLDASRWGVLRRVEAPSALPYAFSGAKIAGAVAVIGAIFGEWSGATNGLGVVMLRANAQLLIPLLFAAVVVLSAMAIAVFALLALLEKRVVRWR